MRLFHLSQQVMSLYNSIGICQFVAAPTGPFKMQMLADFTSAVTGWDTSLHELMTTGERALNMARLFDLREGFGVGDDDLPSRMFQPLQNGALEGISIDRGEFEAARRMYYEMAGWDPLTGVPSRGKLAELDLLWAAGPDENSPQRHEGTKMH